VTWLGLAANYGPHEHAFMQQLRAHGASRDELAVIHTLTALFDARLDEPQRSGVIAIVDEREHYRKRNTSLVRITNRYEPDAPDVATAEETPTPDALFDEREQARILRSEKAA
jgi:hypothetical protein